MVIDFQSVRIHSCLIFKVRADNWKMDAVLKSVRSELNCEFDDFLELSTGPDLESFYENVSGVRVYCIIQQLHMSFIKCSFNTPLSFCENFSRL